MQLGTFSISLNVKNLSTSESFYEALGFEVFGGDLSQNYLIMKNGTTIIGLFQGMFPENILTFNPKWNANAEVEEEWEDVRTIQKTIEEKGFSAGEKIESKQGAANFMVKDPDGNLILFDQHV